MTTATTTPPPTSSVSPTPPGSPYPTGPQPYRWTITAAMVVEVADSSLFLDTTTKAELYATAGIPEYWVIDLEGKQLLVFRDPVALPTGLGATAYRTHDTLGPTEIIAPLVAPVVNVRFCDLLP